MKISRAFATLIAEIFARRGCAPPNNLAEQSAEDFFRRRERANFKEGQCLSRLLQFAESARETVSGGDLHGLNQARQSKSTAPRHDWLAKLIENYVRQLRTDKVFVYFT